MKHVFTLLLAAGIAGSVSVGVQVHYATNSWDQAATNKQLKQLIIVVKENPALSGRLKEALVDEKITSIEYLSIMASIESGAEKKQLVNELKLLTN